MVQKTIENAAHILEQVIYLVTVCRLGIRVRAQGAGTHHEKEKCQESPHDSQEHRVLHATWCDGRPRTWHCRDQAQQSVSSQKGLKRPFCLIQFVAAIMTGLPKSVILS